MELLYFKSKKGNFGDDLNPWLWPQLIPDFDKRLSDTCFVGIGSILHEKNKGLDKFIGKPKIVFGTGVRPSYSKFILDPSWNVKFLRGPLSSKYFDDKYKFISDSAYAVRLLDDYKAITSRKKYKVSFIPYFKSVDLIDWEKICRDNNIHYISPFSEDGVESTLREILDSEYIFTEAMHGAILADAFRVPWRRLVFSTPFTEGQMVSEFKWNDWLQSVDINSINSDFVPSYSNTNFLSRFVDRVTFKSVNTSFLSKSKSVDKLDSLFGNILSKEFYLSKEPSFNRVVEEIEYEVASLSGGISK